MAVMVRWTDDADDDVLLDAGMLDYIQRTGRTVELIVVMESSRECLTQKTFPTAREAEKFVGVLAESLAADADRLIDVGSGDWETLDEAEIE